MLTLCKFFFFIYYLKRFQIAKNAQVLLHAQNAFQKPYKRMEECAMMIVLLMAMHDQLIKRLINQHVLKRVEMMVILTIEQKENALRNANIMNMLQSLKFVHYVVIQFLVVLHVPMCQTMCQTVLNAKIIKNSELIRNVLNLIF